MKLSNITLLSVLCWYATYISKQNGPMTEGFEIQQVVQGAARETKIASLAAPSRYGTTWGAPQGLSSPLKRKPVEGTYTLGGAQVFHDICHMPGGGARMKSSSLLTCCASR